VGELVPRALALGKRFSGVKCPAPGYVGFCHGAVWIHLAPYDLSGRNRAPLRGGSREMLQHPRCGEAPRVPALGPRVVVPHFGEVWKVLMPFERVCVPRGPFRWGGFIYGPPLEWCVPLGGGGPALLEWRLVCPVVPA